MVVLLVVLGVFTLFGFSKDASADVTIQGQVLSDSEYKELVASIPKGHRLVTNEEHNFMQIQRLHNGLHHQAHVQKRGWEAWLRIDTHIAGTTGKGLRMEAIKLFPKNMDMNIEYRAHVQGIGWQGWKSNGNVAGTTGQARRMEALQIKTTGKYGVQYRAHVQTDGWLGWVTSNTGRFAGTTGKAKRLEALQFLLTVRV